MAIIVRSVFPLSQESDIQDLEFEIKLRNKPLCQMHQGAQVSTGEPSLDKKASSRWRWYQSHQTR